jgi:27-O-demethylrifamycin SV methyltransferase
VPRALASRASPSPPPPDGRGSSLAARAGSRSDASVSTERAAHHYDAVTEAWRRWVMGDDLHFGLFASPSDTLAEATARLTRTLASRAALEPELEVLDLGCGVGTSALRLAEEESCYVTGVSTSAVGIGLARQRAAERGLADRTRFLVMDAQHLTLDDESVDRVYALESVHLMPDKAQVFRECFRVLRPGGRLALCDVALVGGEDQELVQYAMLGHSAPVAARMRDAVYATMHRAFGSSGLTQHTVYTEAVRAAGFADVVIEDLSAATRRTLACWADNASAHHAALEAALGAAYVESLYMALLHMSFGWGRLGGYIALSATKPG